MTHSEQSKDNNKPSSATLPTLKKYFFNHKITLCKLLISLIITSSLILSIGNSLEWIINNVFSQTNSETLNKTAMMSIGIIACLAISIFFRYYYVNTLGEKIISEIKHDLFQKLLKLSPIFYEENKISDILARITSDTEVLKSVIGSFISSFLRNSFLFIGAVIMMIFTSPKLSLYILSIIPITIIPILIYGRKVRKLSKFVSNNNANLSSYIDDTIRGIKLIQSFTYEKESFLKFNDLLNAYKNTAFMRIINRGLLTAIVVILIFSAVIFILWSGGNAIISGALTSGSLSSFLFFAILSALSLTSISEIIGEIQRARGSMERIIELLNLDEEEYTAYQKHKVTVEDIIIDPVKPIIEFNNVSFKYPNLKHTSETHTTLSNLNFTINPGETIAIVGKSGSGKSTILDIILRFYDIQKGNIYLSGIDIYDLNLTKYRELFAIVPQETAIFSTSVHNNLSIGNPQASHEDLVEASKITNSYDFINNMPQGFDSDLGDKGIKISGGEKQRMSITRAVLRKPKILLLDEATSSLDQKNEEYIQNALNNITKDTTTIIVAHRLSTIINSDKIIYIEAGEIKEIGTHQELLGNNSYYKKLYHNTLTKVESSTK